MVQRLSDGSLFDTGRDVIQHNLKFTSNNFMFRRAEGLIDEKRSLNEDELGCFGRVGKFIDTLIIGAASYKDLLTAKERASLISEYEAREVLEFVFKDTIFKDGSASFLSLEELEGIIPKLEVLSKENNNILSSKSTDLVLNPEFKEFVHKMYKKYLRAMLRENYEQMNCMPW